MDNQTTPEPAETNLVITECKFKREGFSRKFLWQVSWLLIGLVLGYLVSTIRVHQTNKQQRVSTILYWAKSVTDEIDYNVQWGTDSPSYSEKGNEVILRSYLRDSALRNFLDILPELQLRNPEISEGGRILEHLIASLNQLVDQRNSIKNETFMALNTQHHIDKLRTYEGTLEIRLEQVKSHSTDYRKLLASVVDSL